MTPLLELRGVRKVFPARDGQGEITALDGVDLRLDAGEFLSLVGASGGGKSTLMDLVAGFARPTAGEVLLRDGAGTPVPVRGPGPDRVVVFQDHAVFPWYTALDNVAYGLRRQGVGRREARSRALEALEHMGLADFAAAWPASLSGGMRQRVALARALVLRPAILLLDEPFASLDELTRQRLQEDLAVLWGRQGWAVIFVSHMLDEAVWLADRVAVLDGGRLLAGETVDRPRPRRRDDPHLGALAATLRRQMERGHMEPL